MKKSSVLLIVLFLIIFSGCNQADAYQVPIVNGSTDENYNITIDVKKDTLLTELLSDTADTVAVYTGNGEVIQTTPDQVIFHHNGEVSVIDQTYETLYGIITDYPEAAVTNVYTETLDALEQGEHVMVLYLDGFGYQSYRSARDSGLIPNMAVMGSKKAASMFPTITPVNFAAMVTGQTPAVNGVTQRGVHKLSCDSIFDAVLALGKTDYLVEGDSQIISFSIDQELNPDLDGDGDTDYEVMKSALSARDSGKYDLLFVHLHGIDDTSHATGPQSEETLAKIAQTDTWVGQLADGFQGKIIIVADHGQHENDGNCDEAYADKKGVHGAFVSSDIFVPLLIAEQ